MKKLSKAILIACAAVALLAVVAFFGVNLYIQSPGTQARIQEQLSDALRMPLRITNTSLTPWSDLKITGITIPNGTVNFLDASAFNARYRLSPLFGGKLIITEMSVDRPHIVWAQNAEGKWVVPKAAKKTASVAASPSPQTEPVKKEPKRTKQSGFQVVVDGFQIRNGTVELLDKDRHPVAIFTDVNMNYTTLTADRLEGTAEIGRIVWNEWLAFNTVRTPFRYAAGELELPQITAMLAGGAVHGSFRMRGEEPEAPFVATLEIEGVNAAKLSTDAGWSEGQALGTLSGNIEAHGSSKEVARLEGKGRLQIRDGRFRQLELLETIGLALQIRQLSDLRLKDGRAEFHLADEKAFVDALSLEALDLRITAEGLVRFDGKVQFASRLSVDDALHRQLPGIVADNFTAEPGERHALAFDVTGKNFKPKTNLLEKVIGKKIGGQFEDLVSTIFSSRKKEEPPKKEEKKKDRKKKKDEPKPVDETPPAPVPSPAPAEPQPQ